ncbi:MAG: DUF1080 domain-containing protein [Planctomycetia bacterium]|nr:DUF1080 domain-containing protein [Planctomycetia bacterium]
MRRLAIGWSIVFAASAFLLQAQEPVKVATDPEKAGPDYAVQGEYVGETADKAKLGAEVIAKGNGSFVVNFLPGGLRGEGGDYAKRVEGTAKTEDGKTNITTKDGKWTGSIASGKLTGKNAEGQSFALEKTIRKSKTLGEKPPAGAVVLFDGKDASEWKNGKLIDGNLAGSDVASLKTFKDHKLHLEFRLSYMPFQSGQGRSNSGVYVQHRYEVQVLDSFGLKGANNECGGVYSQKEPSVNMCYPPLQWQTYDIEFKAPRFADGKKTSPAVLSVWHNDVQIHDKLELKGLTGGAALKDDDAPGPYFLQGHGGQVQYRNIWVVEAK